MRSTFAAVCCVIILATAGCQKKNDQPPLQKTSGAVQAPAAASNVSAVISVERRENKAPLFTWTDGSGKKVTFDEFAQGGGVLVNFWATWCGPCRREIPDLVALDAEYRAKGVKVIGISADKDGDVMATVTDFVRGASIAYPIVIDNGELEAAFGGIRGLPTTILIDKNGTIVKRMIGLQSKEVFAKAMDTIKQ
jgi:thiol-disulfide isomerase/thioredoxin